MLMAGIALSVTAATTVGLFIDRLERAIRIESATVLAADLRLESGRDPASLSPAEQRAHDDGLLTARLTSFSTVVHAGDEAQLATVIAADRGYPLRGQLQLAATAYGISHASLTLPESGCVYLDPRLAVRLGTRVGDEIRVGASHLRIAAILADRPDRGSSMAEVAPAVLMRAQDLERSGLIGPASRATYALLVAGPQDKIDRYAVWLEKSKSPAEKLITVKQSSAQLGAAAERAGRFLHLAAVTTLLLSAVALALTSRRYVAQRRDEVALLKCMGATSGAVFNRHVRELLWTAAYGAAGGIILGYLSQIGLARLAAVFTPMAVLPQPGLVPVLLGFMVALIVTAGFALPPVLELARISPARILREDVQPKSLPVIVPGGAAVAALLALLIFTVRDLKLVIGAGITLTVLIIIYCAAALGTIRLVRMIRSDAGNALRYGIRSLARRPLQTLTQLIAFGLAITFLLLLGVVRGDLIEQWQHTVPAQAPNHFLINISVEDRDAVADFFAVRGATVEFAPWVRARLLRVNGTPVAERMPNTERGRAFAEREQNLTFSASIPVDNHIVEGHWWPATGVQKPMVSVATEFRDELKLKVGDQLEFDVAGEHVKAELGSVRKVRWDGFRPNFFIVFSPGVLEGNVGSYLGAVHLESAARRDLPQFDRQFPTVTVLDVEGLLKSIRTLLDKAAAAVAFVFGFTLLAGFVVLQAGVDATAEQRRYESALLRSLGASRFRVLSAVWSEFALLGALAGSIAALMAAMIGIGMASWWLDLPWQPTWRLFVFGAIGGAVLVGCAGSMSAWRLTLSAPARILRGS
jgi:putative ABC transport system permease protein